MKNPLHILIKSCKFLKMGMVVLVIIGLPLQVYAQDEEANDSGGGGGGASSLGIGAKIGGSFNQFSQPGSMIGFAGGAFGNYQLLDFMAVQLELLYMQQGGGRENYLRNYSEIGGNVLAIDFLNRSVLFHNIEVPLLFKFGLPDHNGPISPKFILGASYGFAFGAFELHDKMYYFENGTQHIRSNEMENVGANYEQHQFGYNVGVGIDYNLPDGKTFTTEIRYRGGLNDLNLINFAIPEIGGDLYTSSLGFFFGLTIF